MPAERGGVRSAARRAAFDYAWAVSPAAGPAAGPEGETPAGRGAAGLVAAGRAATARGDDSWSSSETPRHRRAAVSALAAFPAVAAVQALLGDAVGDWPLAARALLLGAVVAPTLAYVTLPLATRACAAWLASPRR